MSKLPLVGLIFLTTIALYHSAWSAELDTKAELVPYKQLEVLLPGNTLTGTFIGNKGRWAEYLAADGKAVYISGTENRIKGLWGVDPKSNELCFRFEKEPFDFCYFVEFDNTSGNFGLVHNKTAERYFLIDQVCKGDVFGLMSSNDDQLKQPSGCEKVSF